MDSKTATLNRVKSYILREECEQRRAFWKAQGYNLVQLNKFAQQLIKQVNAIKTFTALADCEDLFPDHDGYERIIEMLDKI